MELHKNPEMFSDAILAASEYWNIAPALIPFCFKLFITKWQSFSPPAKNAMHLQKLEKLLEVHSISLIEGLFYYNTFIAFNALKNPLKKYSIPWSLGCTASE